MKKYLIEWQTDYSDCFAERMGADVVEAENKEKAVEKFYKNNHRKEIVTNIEEM